MPDTPSADLADPAVTPRDMRILVIDDNELDRQRVLRLCSRAGLRFDAVEVASLDEMAAALDETAFDLIFVDYLLAGETGLDAVDALIAHPDQHAAAAIMIAGEGQIDIAVEAMRRGCSDYLTKSMMNVDTLQKSIASALERRMLFTAIDEERRYATGDGGPYAADLGTLEQDIDRLWDALPAFGEAPAPADTRFHLAAPPEQEQLEA
jgi:DNA-binding NtrC family response regulator